MLAACQIYETSPRFPPRAEHTDTSWSRSRLMIAATSLPAAITSKKWPGKSDDSSDKRQHRASHHKSRGHRAGAKIRACPLQDHEGGNPRRRRKSREIRTAIDENEDIGGATDAFGTRDQDQQVVCWNRPSARGGMNPPPIGHIQSGRCRSNIARPHFWSTKALPKSLRHRRKLIGSYSDLRYFEPRPSARADAHMLAFHWV
jgi:hypothetical protein